MASTHGTRRRPVFVVFMEMEAGDRRKVEAQSNDADTGGGARDFRFNHKAFDSAFAKLFPRRASVPRKRNQKREMVEQYIGDLTWLKDPSQGDGLTEKMDITYEPPTNSRPTEGRITNVPAYPPLRNPPPESEGRLFLLLILDASGAVWARYATLKSLKGGGWNASVARAITTCAEDTPEGKSVDGYIDIDAGTSYCHG